MELGISATIQNGFDEDSFWLFGIVNRVRKAFWKQPVIAKNFRMNSGVQSQRINIREKRFQKITAQTFFLLFVESEAVR